MRNLTLLFLLFLGSSLFGQTDSIEKSLVLNKYAAKELRQDEYANIIMSWKETMKQFEKYPEIPIDQNGQAHYMFLYEFKDFPAEKLYSRALEWLSINYGLIPSYIYSNQADGKIIFRNSVTLATGNNCLYTSVITVKNEKLLMEITGIAFQTISAGHMSGETWIPESTIEFGINEVYPVILKRISAWKTNLTLLKSTNDFFDTEKLNLFTYISTYDNSYNF